MVSVPCVPCSTDITKVNWPDDRLCEQWVPQNHSQAALQTYTEVCGFILSGSEVEILVLN